MHRFELTRRLLIGSLAAVVGFQGIPAAKAQPAAAAPTAKPSNVRVGKTGELLVPLGGIVEFVPKIPGERTIKDTLTGNEQVLQTRPSQTNPNGVLLVGLNPGVTKLTFTLDNGAKAEFEVVVQPDYDLLKRVIQRAVPTASVEVLPGVGTAVILTGYVNKPEDAAIIERIAGGAVGTPGTTGPGAGGAGAATGGNANIINAIQVGGVQHVMIEVVIAQVDRTELRERGADFLINGTTANFSSLLNGLISTGGGATLISPNANLQFGLVPAQLFVALRALRTEGLAKFLSEPKVTTQSGRPAFIRSGGQQAVLSATGGGLGSISVTLEPVGTQLEVLPIVYGNGKIYLEVNPTIRARNDGSGIQTTAGFSPGFTEQTTRASVMLESGQTFAIGGLLETTTQAINNKVPFVGDLPFIGTAFSNIRYDERERELIVMVTPRLVDPLDCNQVPKRVPGRETRSSDDYELYLEGLIEAPRGQRQVWNGRCYNAAYKCDPTYGTYPCKGNVCNGSNGNGAAGCSTTGILTGNGGATVFPSALPSVIRPMPTTSIVPTSMTNYGTEIPTGRQVETALPEPLPIPLAEPTGAPLAPVVPVNIPSIR